VYAPLAVAAPFGLVALLAKRQIGVALVAFDAFAWMFAVNLTYPLPEGGWCTGPRFLLPALPFVFLAVAGLLGADRSGTATSLGACVAAASACWMLACVAVGGRFPDTAHDPLTQIVLPRWLAEPIPGLDVLAGGRQFEWNVGRWLIDSAVPADWRPPEISTWRALEFAPLPVYYMTLSLHFAWRSRRKARPATQRPGE
jgi:hypothetical protein